MEYCAHTLWQAILPDHGATSALHWRMGEPGPQAAYRQLMVPLIVMQCELLPRGKDAVSVDSRVSAQFSKVAAH